VLDLYSYAGGFALRAAEAGAGEVTGIDSSAPALALASASADDNGLADTCTFRRGDVFAEAQRLAGSGERFDVVVADPPAFARSKRDAPAALRGYRKLARMVASLTVPGGFAFLASCSHNVGAAEFADVVRRGLADAGRTGRILRSSGAAPDHPVHPDLPESAYLKALTLTID
jgi:23S rRNA (cytosine1962-C5)-methyltransferase